MTRLTVFVVGTIVLGMVIGGVDSCEPDESPSPSTTTEVPTTEPAVGLGAHEALQDDLTDNTFAP